MLGPSAQPPQPMEASWGRLCKSCNVSEQAAQREKTPERGNVGLLGECALETTGGAIG